ncbi:MAG: hypothetical protein M1358_04650 [Chloroflexi bacterium]|nr:hypothetical protein [Chloroflexota bacterium]
MRGQLLRELQRMSEVDAIEKFGPDGESVRNFVMSLKDYTWFQHVYRREPWDRDPDIVRVHSWRQAWAMLPSTNQHLLSALRYMRAVRDTLQQTKEGASWQRWCLDADYYGYNVVKSVVKDIYREAGGKAAVLSGHAASELAMQHAVPDPPHYFLDLMPYCQQGHWPLGLRDDGKLIVF